MHMAKQKIIMGMLLFVLALSFFVFTLSIIGYSSLKDALMSQ